MPLPPPIGVLPIGATPDGRIALPRVDANAFCLAAESHFMGSRANLNLGGHAVGHLDHDTLTVSSLRSLISVARLGLELATSLWICR
ncbi:hypothetical protein [Mesorhizobium sp. WSM4313]|uniref:hypothetical protein n=1 Tax=Mesorhizobium sp. WSM4313 TaxID=2029412 RepID=UPI001140A8CC|nr:hypothetical protein [Mesorhizobium sp. WSM4313]